jgi:crossover junction endodeoxyribonuclease RuvC
MIVLGIDPGTARMGCAVLKVSKTSDKPELVYSHVITTPTEMLTEARLLVLFNEVSKIAQKYKLDKLAIEKLFFNTNVTTAISVGQARGVALLVAAQHKLEVFEYTALQAKLILTGYGRADKKDMQKAVKEHLHLEDIIKSDDANDAVAMALCYFKKEIQKYEVPKKPSKSKDRKKA